MVRLLGSVSDDRGVGVASGDTVLTEPDARLGPELFGTVTCTDELEALELVEDDDALLEDEAGAALVPLVQPATNAAAAASEPAMSRRRAEKSSDIPGLTG